MSQSQSLAPAIVFDRVSLDFDGKPLFQDLSLRLAGGQTTCILGPSGCGKSTLLKLIASAKDSQHSPQFCGNIGFDPPPESDRVVAWMGQNDLLLPWLPLLDNVLLGARLRRELSDALRHKALQLIREAGLTGYEQALPSALSGGMRQRGALLRTLMEQRPVLLMDEPTSAIDPIGTAKIEELVEELKTRFTIVIVTHNMQQAARISDYTAFFYKGYIVEYGLTEQIFRNPVKKETEDYITGRFG